MYVGQYCTASNVAFFAYVCMCRVAVVFSLLMMVITFSLSEYFEPPNNEFLKIDSVCQSGSHKSTVCQSVSHKSTQTGKIELAHTTIPVSVNFLHLSTCSIIQTAWYYVECRVSFRGEGEGSVVSVLGFVL